MPKKKEKETTKTPIQLIAAGFSEQSNTVENWLRATERLFRVFPTSTFEVDTIAGVAALQTFCEERTSEAVEWKLTQAIALVEEQII